MEIKPQEGAQMRFLQNAADICVFGGSAGSSKTFSLLLEAARHIHVPGYGAVIFRREFRQVVVEGGLRDTAMEIYPHLGGIYRSQPTPHFIFPSTAKISFGHLNMESDCLSWQGSQIAMIGFDEATHFTDFQITYLMSRNRSTCGVRPYMRLTCNPDSDSWLANFLSWWIDQETGYPIKERGGALRYMTRINGERVWGNSRQELVDRYGESVITSEEIKSVSFVPALISDNPILLRKDPGYLGNLKALSKVERARLLDGNWKVRAAAGMYFPREDARILDWMPHANEVVKWVRSWDLAASEETEGRDPDWTVGMLCGRKQNGKIVIADVIRVRRKAAAVRSLVRSVAMKDGKDVWIVLPRDPGQAGRDQSESYLQMLAGFTVISRAITRSKTTMAEPAAALWQQGNIEIVREKWNEDLLAELEAFPEGKHDDLVDALSGSVRNLPGHARPDYSQTGLSGRFKPVQMTPRGAKRK
jgi:predicted phage terminase large subunit-like protein